MSNTEMDDLEDGEIEEDEEEVNAPAQEAPKKPNSNPKSESKSKSSAAQIKNDSNKSKKSSDKSDSSRRRHSPPPPKRKRPAVVEDDFSAELEKALAMALKKDGVEPPMPNLPSQKKSRKSDEEDIDDRSRSRKRRKGNSGTDKHKKKSRNDTEKPRQDQDDFDEYEMLCVRGGSPPPNVAAPVSQGRGQNDYYDSDHSSASSTYEANENKKRSNYEEKRQRHREKMQRDRKMRNDNKRGGGGRNRGDSEGDDCMRSHESRAPRKMELCKFYLMECCAKRENCLYMHSDFPCKYYYLGMKCQTDKCFFMHGKPLTDQLRMILLKHLETAPKEILGDFPRLNHDTAVKMLTTTHKRLTEEYEARHRPPSSAVTQQQASKIDDGKTDDGIPSLFDINAMKPPLQPNNNNSNRSSDKPRKSRWCDPPGQILSIPPPSLLSRPPPQITQQMALPPPEVMSLQSLGNVISSEQLDVLAKIGINTLEQLNQLTVGQLGDLGISISQLSEIQMNAKNIKLGLPADTKGEQEGNLQLGLKDLDMRVTHPASTPALSESLGFGGGQDVDMRFLAPPVVQEQPPPVEKKEPLKIAEIASPDHQPMSFYQPPTDSQDKNAKADPAVESNQKSGDAVVDYSQYLRDSNLMDKDDDHEENNREESDSPLLIDESYCASDDEKMEDSANVESDTNEAEGQPAPEENQVPLQPAIIDPTALTRSSIMANLSKIDLSASVSQLLNKINMNRLEAAPPQETPVELSYAPITSTSARASTPPMTTSVATPPTVAPPAISPAQTEKDTRDPRMRLARNSGERTSLLAANSASDGETTQSNSSIVKARSSNERVTIYDQPSDDDGNGENADDYENIYGKKSTSNDRDMRFPYGTSDFSSNSDIDLRLSLPFKPVHHHVPATEIDGSISSYMPKPYKVAVVDVPKPRYRELRKNKPQHTLDPRLRRIFGFSDEDSDEINSVDPLLQRLREKQQQQQQQPQQQIAEPTPTIASPTSTPPTPTPAPYVAPRVDPRRKKETQAAEAATTSSHTLDIQSVIHKNNWYKDLSSKQKIMVNQQLALLSMEMKKFQQDPNPDKVFDLSCVVTNSVLQDVLLNLGIYIDDSGNFIEVSDDDSSNGPKNQSLLPPPAMMGMPPPLDFLHLPPPHTLPPPPINRPGLLGMDNNFRFTGPPPIVFPPGRPGLLGVAPPNVRPFNAFVDPTTAVSQMIMQTNSSNMNMNNNGGNYRNSGGRSGHQNNDRWGRNNDRNRRDRDHRHNRDNKKN